nr:immunoglobulin light chain junction region [Macaca mulatta]
CQHGYAPPFSF